MLFCSDLEEIIFNRHYMFDADELVVLSGYIGPAPVKRLKELPFSTTVIYGMYGSEGIKSNLHKTLVGLDNEIQDIKILYSGIPVHSKCYIWKKDNKIVHALVGSANFSSNGLSTPFKEVLAETTYDTFEPMNRYLTAIIGNSVSCTDKDINVRESSRSSGQVFQADGDFCTMVLYDPRTGEVPSASGLNWGHSPTAHTHIDDAYIPIRVDYIRRFPDLFPKKQMSPTVATGLGRQNRQNDAIEIIWDDGRTMVGLLEGSQPIDNAKYPKQISSHPEKKILGEYIRERIGVSPDHKIIFDDLQRYGRTDIKVSLQGEGIYYFDFSV